MLAPGEVFFFCWHYCAHPLRRLHHLSAIDSGHDGMMGRQGRFHIPTAKNEKGMTTFIQLLWSVFLIRTWAVCLFGSWENMTKSSRLSSLVSTVLCPPLCQHYYALLWIFVIVWYSKENGEKLSHYMRSSLSHCSFLFSGWRGWDLHQRRCGNDRRGSGLQGRNKGILSILPSDPAPCSWF